MYIQNGEWDIILKVRFGRYVKTETWKSLRFLIISLLVLFAIIPAVIMEAVVLTSYEKRAVEVRTAEIQNQCTILCNQLSQGGYPKVVTTEAMNAEITQLSNILSISPFSHSVNKNKCFRNCFVTILTLFIGKTGCW